MKKGMGNSKVNPRILKYIAVTVLPFYRRIVTDSAYARAWTRSVVKAYPHKQEKLFRMVVPTSRRIDFSTNGIGYFFDFKYAKPIYTYANGTSLRPGRVQFDFDTKTHQAIAKTIIPLYRELARNDAFVCRVVRYIRKGKTCQLAKLIRQYVKSPYLK